MVVHVRSVSVFVLLRSDSTVFCLIQRQIQGHETYIYRDTHRQRQTPRQRGNQGQEETQTETETETETKTETEKRVAAAGTAAPTAFVAAAAASPSDTMTQIKSTVEFNKHLSPDDLETAKTVYANNLATFNASAAIVVTAVQTKAADGTGEVTFIALITHNSSPTDGVGVGAPPVDAAAVSATFVAIVQLADLNGGTAPVATQSNTQAFPTKTANDATRNTPTTTEDAPTAKDTRHNTPTTTAKPGETYARPTQRVCSIHY